MYSCKTLIILAIFLFFNGCAKKDISAPSLVEAKNQQEVVERFLKIPENASDDLIYLVNDIKNTEEQYHFLYEYIQRNGMPNWGSTERNVPIIKAVTTKTGNVTSNSVVNNSSTTSSSGETFFIPLIDTVSKEVKSYIFCRKFRDGKVTYKTYNKQAILTSTAKDSNDVKVKGIELSVFAHFERKINNKTSLLLPFPYNYNFNNAELKFLSNKIPGANNITKTATSGGLVKMDGGCQEAFIAVSAFDFFRAFGQTSSFPLGTTLEFTIICGSGGATLITVIAQPINSGPSIPNNPPSTNPLPTPPPNYNPQFPPPSIPYFPYIPPITSNPGTVYGGGGNGLTPINGIYPPNWVEDPNNPWISQGPMLDLIGMPGSNPTYAWSPPYVSGEVDPDYYLNSIDAYHKSKIEEYYNSIDHYWENSTYDNIFPPYDLNRDGQRDADGYRKNGSVYHYQGGDVQNYTDDNGGKYAVFTMSNGEIIKFPGATISDFGVLDKSGVTTPNGGIRMSTNQNKLVDLQHEYGHILHAHIIGSAAYFSKVVPSSLFSAILSTLTGSSHQSNWTEKIANNLSAAYFGPNSDIAKSTYYQK